jgi:hypothetical protein
VFRRLLPLSLLVAALVLPATASAATNVAVGIGDQSPRMFSDSNYQALKLKKTRYFIHWDAASKPAELRKADQFVQAARQRNVRVLMHISTNNLTSKQAKLPSVAQYRTAVKALITRYKPFGVTEWGVWNEANHPTQPTYRSPQRAAQFYKTMKSLCKGCKIVALDVLDQAGVEKYIKRWLSAAGPAGRTAKIVGIHNYSEVNRRIKKGTNRYPGTARIIKAVRTKNKTARFWYTETGGVVNFGGAFPCNRKRAVSRNAFMFGLAKKFDRDIERLYTYNWTGADCQGFDAGLIDANGKLRPAYAPFKKALRSFRK